MAEFTLSSGRLPSGGGSRGLQADTIQANGGAGAIQAANINPNAANITYTPTGIPQTVNYKAGEAALKFMDVSMDAAFKFQQREARYQASEATLAFQTKARELYSGYEDEDGKFVKGLSSYKGGLAGPAYQQYQADLDKLMADSLSGMEPRVKQEALVAIQSAKNQSLTKGATHRATQMKVAEDDVRFRYQQEMSIQIATDPSLVARDKKGNLTRDPLQQNTNIRERYIGSFDSYADGSKSWESMIRQAGEKVYFDNYDPNDPAVAVDAAMKFKEEIARVELGAKEFTAFSASIRSWENQAIQKELANFRLQDKQEKAKVELEQDQLIASWQNNPPSEEEARTAIELGEVDYTKGVSYVNRVFGKVNQAAEPYQIEKWFDRIDNAVMKDGKAYYTDENGQDKLLKNAWASDQPISRDGGALNIIQKHFERFNTPEFKDITAALAPIKEQLKDQIDKYNIGQDDGKIIATIDYYRRLLIEKSAGGADRAQLFEYASKWMVDINRPPIDFASTPTVEGTTRPEKLADFATAKKELAEQRATNKIDGVEYVNRFKRLLQQERAMEAEIKAQAEADKWNKTK